MTPPPKYNPSQLDRAFSLVEVVLVIGIISFAVIGMVGLWGVGLQTSSNSSETVAAANLAALMINQRRLAPVDNSANPSVTGSSFALPSLDKFSDLTVSGSAVYVGANGLLATGVSQSSYGLIYTITPQTPPPNVYLKTTNVYILLYWPPQAAFKNAAGRYEITTQILLP